MPVGTGIVTIVADLGTINVALPTIADYFGADLLTAQWIVVGYALTISALLMPMGRLSDIIGLKQVYVGGFLIFVVAAVLASISNSMLTLILARVLMGCGTAMTQGTSMAIVAGAFPSSQRGTAMGGLIGMVGVGSHTRTASRGLPGQRPGLAMGLLRRGSPSSPVRRGGPHNSGRPPLPARNRPPGL